jgi:hypothetical protein
MTALVASRVRVASVWHRRTTVAATACLMVVSTVAFGIWDVEDRKVDYLAGKLQSSSPTLRQPAPLASPTRTVIRASTSSLLEAPAGYSRVVRRLPTHDSLCLRQLQAVGGPLEESARWVGPLEVVDVTIATFASAEAAAAALVGWEDRAAQCGEFVADEQGSGTISYRLGRDGQGGYRLDGALRGASFGVSLRLFSSDQHPELIALMAASVSHSLDPKWIEIVQELKTRLS